MILIDKIKGLFKKSPELPPTLPVVLTREQMQDMLRYDIVEKPPMVVNLDVGSRAWFIDKNNVPQVGTVIAILKKGGFIVYKVRYNVKSDKNIPPEKLRKTRRAIILTEIAEHWRGVQRLYEGLQKAGSANKAVIDYTEGKVAAHKKVISFLEAQLVPLEDSNGQ